MQRPSLQAGKVAGLILSAAAEALANPKSAFFGFYSTFSSLHSVFAILKFDLIFYLFVHRPEPRTLLFYLQSPIMTNGAQ